MPHFWFRVFLFFSSISTVAQSHSGIDLGSIPAKFVNANHLYVRIKPLLTALEGGYPSRPASDAVLDCRIRSGMKNASRRGHVFDRSEFLEAR